jgi:hypothetical protein
MMVKTKKEAQSKNSVSVISSDINITTHRSSSLDIQPSPSVTEFLSKHESLEPILAEAPDKIQKFFPDAEIDFELTTDPEVENWQYITVIIFTHLSAEEAFEQLKKFKKDWWLEVYVKGDGKLCLDIEFV